MKALYLLALVPCSAFAQSNPNCTLPPNYGLVSCGEYACEVMALTGDNGSYDIPSPYEFYGCTQIGDGSAYDIAYTPPEDSLAPGDPIAPSTAVAPEIDPQGLISGLTLLAGLVMLMRGRRFKAIVPRTSSAVL